MLCFSLVGGVVHALESGGHSSSPTHALLINGGGSRRINYQSHLLHVKQLYRLLLDSGVAPGSITILSADGSDPGADLAVREVQSEQDFWLLSGTSLERRLQTRVNYQSSEIAGVDLQPATRASLRGWFETASKRLRPGDTLLLYVTDHGTRNKEDARNNRITLWGKDEKLAVGELRELIATLDERVGVLTLMSQCYSGAFANLMYAVEGNDLPRGNISGFFSSTAERRAYGCYPENRDKDNVGHSFRFIEALRRASSFAQAHKMVLATDRTPDVPLKTSDLYLETVLRAEAGRLDKELDPLVDQLLYEAWRDRGIWEPEIRLLDQMGDVFGYFSPRFLSELGKQADLLSQVSEQFASYKKAWEAAQKSLNRENLKRFFAANPHWSDKVSEKALKGVNATRRHELARELLRDLVHHTREDQETRARLELLREKAEATRKASYRMEVREGVILRMRFVLISIAGRVYLARHGTAAERKAYNGVVNGEALALRRSGESPAPLLSPEPFPPYHEELRLAEQALPGWMGIRFRPVSPARREKFQLEPGAVSVIAVYPDSPALKTGLEVGDIILGTPGEPFTEPERIREWTMTATIGEPQHLQLQRGEERISVRFTPKPYPRKWPKLPGPPNVGSAAPILDKLQSFRGSAPAEMEGPYLLFFWATWCGPCKAALPELAAFERERGIPVIAITDELPEKLEAFFQNYKDSFPDLVATDEFRHSFVAYGVSATPSFVLVDAQGKIQSVSKGYRPNRGLGVEGWSWAGPG